MAKRKRLTKKQRKRRKHWLIVIFIGILFFISGYIAGHKDLDFSQVQTKLDSAKNKIGKEVKDFELAEKTNKVQSSEVTEGMSEIHIFDIGQGSSVLLIAKDGSNILIGTGPSDDSEKEIITYLDEEIGLGEEIDLLIFSTNDSDHIGHADLVLEYFDVQEVWMNGSDHTTELYSNLLDSLLESDTEYKEPKAGDFFDKDSFDIQVLYPEEGSAQKGHNDEPLITRIEFDNISIIIPGATSVSQENEMVERTENLKSDILILADHEADNASSDQWIAAIDPELVFYQLARENNEGDVGNDTMQRLEEAGTPVYGIDELGTISLSIDESGEVDIETGLGLEDEPED